MSSFGRAYHSENAKNPVFDDFKARELMTDDEYRSIAGYILGGIDFFAPEMKGKFESGEKALEYLVNTQIAPTPLGRAAFCEESLKTAVRTGTKQYVILGAGMDTFAFRNPGFACEARLEYACNGESGRGRDEIGLRSDESGAYACGSRFSCV